MCLTLRLEVAVGHILLLVYIFTLLLGAGFDFCATHYYYYSIQNHSLPVKFWNKNQQIFQHSFKNTYLKWKKLTLESIQQLFYPALPTALYEKIPALLGEITPHQ